MTIVEFRALSNIAAVLPSVERGIERIAAAVERIAEAEEQHLKIVVAALARQADNQLPSASAEGTTTNNPTQE